MERLQMSRFLLHLPIYLWTLFDFGGIKSHKTEHNNACIIKFNLTEFYTRVNRLIIFPPVYPYLTC